MKSRMRFLTIVLVMAALVLAVPTVFAKKTEKTPAGWSQGKKTGWEGKSVPPGQAKKEMKQEHKKLKKEKKEKKEHKGRKEKKEKKDVAL